MRRYSTLVIITILMLIAVAARLIPGPRTIDDAFITFRYSRNIVEGQGFVYNPGVHTLGTTTPLFTLIMAAISAVTGGQNFQWYAIVVSTVADAITAALLFLLTKRATGSTVFAIVVGVLWGISPRSVTFAVGGMETSVNILWMVAAVWCYTSDDAVGVQPAAPLYRDKRIWMGIFAGLGLITRIDSALWIAPLFAYQWFEQVRETRSKKPVQSMLNYIPLRTWLACIVTIAPWFIFSTFYFGSPIPNSINAKTVAYVMTPGTAFFTLALGTFSVPFFETQLFPVGARAIAGIVFMALYFLFSLLGFIYAWQRLYSARRLLPFLVYPWLYLAVFSIINPLIFRWYVLPPLPALMLGIVCGIWSIIGNEKLQRFAPAIASVIGIFWIAGSLNVWTLHPDHGADRPAPIMAWHLIELYYEQIGTQLAEEYAVTAETRVASADIGAIGYFSRATIVDTVGLVTPELRRYYPNPPELIAPDQNYAVPPQLILDTQPQYFVTMEGFVRLGLQQNATFNADYTLLREIPTNFYGTGMLLYGRTEDTQP